jgi:hypothetical protein
MGFAALMWQAFCSGLSLQTAKIKIYQPLSLSIILSWAAWYNYSEEGHV